MTQQRFEQLHADPAPTEVLIFVNAPDRVDAVIANPLVMIASDGEGGHPRNAGTFSRILAHYVRELGSVTLMHALRKMRLMTAQRLEKSTAAARRKGRVQEGTDADLIAFDRRTVADRATYQSPRTPSAGIRYEIVNGTVLIDEGRLLPDRYPGKPIEADPTGP